MPTRSKNPTVVHWPRWRLWCLAALMALVTVMGVCATVAAAWDLIAPYSGLAKAMKFVVLIHGGTAAELSAFGGWVVLLSLREPPEDA